MNALFLWYQNMQVNMDIISMLFNTDIMAVTHYHLFDMRQWFVILCSWGDVYIEVFICLSKTFMQNGYNGSSGKTQTINEHNHWS